MSAFTSASLSTGYSLGQIDPEAANTAYFESVSMGPRAAAIGYRALAIGTDAIGIRCDCGLELNGRSAVGAAEVEARALYADHATRCDQALPLPRVS